jgi:hypothetical protein
LANAYRWVAQATGLQSKPKRTQKRRMAKRRNRRYEA